MAKITLDTITSSYAATSLFQSNFTAIEDELNDKVLYRVNPTGEANQMMNDLDMNSNDILNADVIDTVQLRLNGTLVTQGEVVIQNTFDETEFTNSAAVDTFNVSYTVGFVVVILNGVELAAADFTAANGTTVVLATPLDTNADILKIRSFGSFAVADALAKSENLNDVQSASTSRTNLDVYSKAEADTRDLDSVQIGTATYSSNVYTFTPKSSVFRTAAADQVIEFDLPASSITTGQAQINYNGVTTNLNWIDDTATVADDLDDTYTKRIRCRYNGTNWLIVSDVSGDNANGLWYRRSDGSQTCTDQGLVKATNDTLTYAKAFKDTTYSIVYGSSQDAARIISTGGGDKLSTGVTNLYIVDETGAFVTANSLGYTATGRWY